MTTTANKVYLSGPMTGFPNHNYDAFHRVAGYLRDNGFFVMSPAETAGGQYHEDLRPWLLAHDISVITSVDMVFVMPGWERSAGCLLELHVAQETGKPVFQLNAQGDVIGRLQSPVEPRARYRMFKTERPEVTP